MRITSQSSLSNAISWKNSAATQKQLEKIGIDPARIKLEFASAAEGAAYAAIVNNFTSEMAKLGHLELTEEQKEQLTALRDKKAPIKKKGKSGSVAVADDGEDTTA